MDSQYTAFPAPGDKTFAMTTQHRESRLVPALTILLSAFLLFQVQPILAKQILPRFGGSAGVWTVCLVFFQLTLLLGYSYAHWLSQRRDRSRQLMLHVCLLLVSCLTLPIIPRSFWNAGYNSQPALQILGLLTATVGLPYFLLASTAPLLQRWLSGAGQNSDEERSIYRLFAVSNLGSLFGLLSYPFAVEPFLTVHVQAWVWSSAYAIYVVCFIGYVWKTRRAPDFEHAHPAVGAIPRTPPSPARYAYWIGCAALGSALLLSATNQITQNVASIPLLWIVPLSLYLLSFVICFEGRSGGGWYEGRFWLTPAMLATGAMAWALFEDQFQLSIYVALPIYAIGVFFGAVLCHGELARSKPSPDFLTHFYLSVAAGGALGGLLVGLVAPRVFSSLWEMPLVVIALAILGVYACSQLNRASQRKSWIMIFIVAALATTILLYLLGELPSYLDPYGLAWTLTGDARWGCIALLVICGVLLQRYGLIRAVGVTALLCSLVFGWSYHHGFYRNLEFADRNFYGALEIHESSFGGTRLRWLRNGVILHGAEILEQPRRGMPTTYYGPTSGIGRTILADQRVIGPLRIGSIGLGIGTLAAYGKPGDVLRVYEINPADLDVARNRFDYLRDSKGQVELVLGDGRLSLESEIARKAFDKPEQRFDILSVDAFSGDAIPVHLLTREAFAIYARAIKPDGVIAFHVTNSYMNLPPVVEQVARDAGFQAILITDHQRAYIPSASKMLISSDWVLATRSTTLFQQPEIAPYATSIEPRSEHPVWTDEYTNLLQILK